jgi:hypothetical protein
MVEERMKHQIVEIHYNSLAQNPQVMPYVETERENFGMKTVKTEYPMTTEKYVQC